MVILGKPRRMCSLEAPDFQQENMEARVVQCETGSEVDRNFVAENCGKIPGQKFTAPYNNRQQEERPLADSESRKSAATY